MSLRLLQYLICLGLSMSLVGTGASSASRAMAWHPVTSHRAASHPKESTWLEANPQDTQTTQDEESKSDAKPIVELQDDILPESETDITKSSLRSTELLPASTRAWFSVPNTTDFEEHFNRTQLARLADDPEVSPFVEELTKQIRATLDEKNLRAGIKIESIRQIQTGEICFAGVLQDLVEGQAARGSHGLVILVDVTGNEDKAAEMLDEINSEVVKNRHGKIETLQIGGVDVQKVAIQNPKRIRQVRNRFQATCQGWLLIADNEEIFRDILRRLAAPDKINQSMTLSANPTFSRIMQETELFGNQPQFSWYIDPSGYARLIQQVNDEDQEIRRHSNDWAKVLENIGFDVLRGIGGNIGIAMSAKDQELEMLSRTFALAPQDNLTEQQKRFFELIDFAKQKEGATEPHAMIPDSAGGFFGGSWDLSRLLNGVGYIYDSVMEEGAFKRMLDEFKTEPEFQIDVVKLIGMTDGQMFVFSTTEHPVTEASERMAIGIPLKADADVDYVLNSLKKAAKGSSWVTLAGKRGIEVDPTQQLDPDDQYTPPPGFGLDDPEEEEEAERFHLFQKRYMFVHNGILIVANERQFMRQLVSATRFKRLKDAEDYIRVKDTLGQLTDNDKVSFRRFVRLDRMLEANYEVLRSGKMAQSPTMVGRLLNRLHESNLDGATPGARTQKIDGTTLPEDFQKSIAPYLGVSGWVTEVEEDGWRITGCVLKKP